MKTKMPKPVFATYLSGSTKETELRIRNIFQWKKGRPPMGVLIVVALLVVGCCGLVGFSIESSDESEKEAQPGVEENVKKDEVFADESSLEDIYNEFFEEKLRSLSAETPLVIMDEKSFDWNGVKATAVTASNVVVSGDISVLIRPEDEYATPQIPQKENTVMYTISALFVEGQDPIELHCRSCPVSKEQEGISYYPTTTQGAFQQFLSAIQYGENGEVIACPVFCDHTGELTARYYQYRPAYSWEDTDGDGVFEFIYDLDCNSSLMSSHRVYQLIDGEVILVPA